jgi:hypothetical protein
MGTDIDPVPVTGFAPNFSPIPRMAPPPFGSEMVGGAGDGEGPPSWLLSGVAAGWLVVQAGDVTVAPTP